MKSQSEDGAALLLTDARLLRLCSATPHLRRATSVRPLGLHVAAHPWQLPQHHLRQAVLMKN